MTLLGAGQADFHVADLRYNLDLLRRLGSHSQHGGRIDGWRFFGHRCGSVAARWDRFLASGGPQPDGGRHCGQHDEGGDERNAEAVQGVELCHGDCPCLGLSEGSLRL